MFFIIYSDFSIKTAFSGISLFFSGTQEYQRPSSVKKEGSFAGFLAIELKENRIVLEKPWIRNYENPGRQGV
ncbi:hypothetical protein [Bacillus sp. OV322]|uniref:hypothetical protein n=1 Tax=Bacillus sp. OV322 TaxID=1882764 RepID=UPI000B86286C|nr:hypothetical protein [Bacillus sp. OV322]